jgi:hypothetical protein
MLFLFPRSGLRRAGLTALRSGFLQASPSRFRPCLRLALVQISKRTFAGFTYRGFSPHESTPMAGVHQQVQAA